MLQLSVIKILNKKKSKTVYFLLLKYLNLEIDVVTFQLTSEVKWSEVKWSEVKSLSRVRLFATPWSVAYQDPQSTGFSGQEYWSGVPLPSPSDLAKKTLRGDR